ncbi:putative leader peptide [Streptomyces zaomyceticus]|nr:putative leader peptide [Streptomyces zaomyceticus]
MRASTAAPCEPRTNLSVGLLVSAPLVCRRHVDLCRTSSAICPSLRA